MNEEPKKGLSTSDKLQLAGASMQIFGALLTIIAVLIFMGLCVIPFLFM